jgi:hypothetical protein
MVTQRRAKVQPTTEMVEFADEATPADDQQYNYESPRMIKKRPPGRFLVGKTVLPATVVVLLLPLLLLLLLLCRWDDHYNAAGKAKVALLHCREPPDATSNSSVASSDDCCVFLRPYLYFGDPSYPGYPYHALLLNLSANIHLDMWGKQVSQFWAAPVPGVVIQQPTHPNIHPFLTDQGISSVSAIMMPKVGSRTIDALFGEHLSVPRTQLQQQQPKVGTPTLEFWNEVTRRQQQQSDSSSPPNDVVFALLRDPVERFLSSVAQTLSSPMAPKWEAKLRVEYKPSREDVWRPCLALYQDHNATMTTYSSSSSSAPAYAQLVQCLLDSMMHNNHKDNVGFFDVHMVPQSVFLAGALYHSNTTVSMFSMDRMDLVFDAFGATQGHKNQRSTKSYHPNIWNLFGPQLVDPTKAREALSDEMIQCICRLYAVDVDLMRYLGFAVNDCLYRLH